MDEAAREARRQRILANSEKRLQRILGLNAPTSSDQGSVVVCFHYEFNNIPSHISLEPGTISAILRETQIEESIHSESIFHEPPQSTTRFRRTVDSAEQSPQDNFSNKEKIPSRDSQDSDNVLLNINQATKKEPDSLKIVLVFLAITVVTMFNTGLGTLIGNVT